jgi:molybdopterin synthase catalytic subunit
MSLFRVLETPLDVALASAAVSAPEIGGIDLFLGAVRDHNDGRPVTLLEYHAYVSMAEKEMQRIADEIAAELPGVRLAALHRIGSLAVGDLAVVCAAGAAHRDEAFRACRLLIDRIKERVPIWKREHGPAGPYWVGWEDARCGAEHSHHHEQ